MRTVGSAESSTVSGTRRPVMLWLRWAPIGWWFLSAATVLVVGERPSSLPALLAAVDAGQVSEMQVVGALPPGADGFVIQDVQWRQGGLSRYAEVRHASPGYTQDQGTSAKATTSIDVATVIRQHSPEVRVRVSPTPSSSITSEIWDWRVPPWLGGFVLAGVLCCLLVLGAGPEPWRATRWAWAWAVLLAAPVGTLAFAMLSGPTPLVPSPRNNDHELVVAHVRGGPRRQPKRGSRQAGSQGPDTWRRVW